MRLTFKTRMSLLVGVSLSFGLMSCQPKPEVSNNEETELPITTSFSLTNPDLLAKSALTSAADTLNTDSTTHSTEVSPHIVDCISFDINTTMAQIDNTSKIEDIDAIKQQLKTCLAHTDSKTVLYLLHKYSDMYDRFLAVDYAQMDNKFYEVLYLAEQHQFIPPEQLEAMSPRVQYLVGLSKSNADVSVTSEGEGYYFFTHNLKAMADLFIPYLPVDQQAFIGRMAKDNQTVFWNDASINLSYRELMERALFWENYIKRYPNGYSIAGAKDLYALYRYSLFFGSDNSSWTDDNYRQFWDAKNAKLLHQLAKRPDSQLAKDAKAFLAFMELKDDERMRLYPVPITDADGYQIQAYQVAGYQLKQAMPIPSPWEFADEINCLNGIFCENLPENIDKTNANITSGDMTSGDTTSTDMTSGSIPYFASLCSANDVEPLRVSQDMAVWGFNPLLADKERQCEPLNLKDYAKMDCEYSDDLMQKPGLILYNHKGLWYQFVYATSSTCQFALGIYDAHSEEV